MLNLYRKNVSFPQNFYAPVGPSGKEEGPWLFDISMNIDRPKLVISSEPFFAFLNPEGKHKELFFSKSTTDVIVRQAS